jgi:hypothetical protein
MTVPVCFVALSQNRMTPDIKGYTTIITQMPWSDEIFRPPALHAFLPDGFLLP